MITIEKIIEILDKNVEIGYEHNYIDAHYDSLYEIAKEIQEQMKNNLKKDNTSNTCDKDKLIRAYSQIAYLYNVGSVSIVTYNTIKQLINRELNEDRRKN